MKKELYTDNNFLTPMMQQYLQIKDLHQDCLLFYRMGDFYELFFEDAKIAASVLDISLTKRGKHQNADIPMCGVPFHASESYLHKLIRADYKVAICEQLESPQEAKKRGYKEVVRREVVRIITPGTITEDNLLESKNPNYLAAIVIKNELAGLAYIDLSTAEFNSFTCAKTTLNNELNRINIKELLISDSIFSNQEYQSYFIDFKGRITTQVSSFFDILRCQNKLKSFYGLAELDSLGDLSSEEISACGSILEYIAITQKDNIPYLPFPKKIAQNQFMVIDSATRKNLELIYGVDNDYKNSVLSIIDQTSTHFGSRLMRQYLASPLIDVVAINKRLDFVEYFVKNKDKQNKVREILSEISDIERALVRINLSRSGPRDFIIIKNGLKQAYLLEQILTDCSNIQSSSLSGYDDLINLIHSSIKDEVPISTKDGDFIKRGFNAKIDTLRDIQKNSAESLDEMREKYRHQTGISNLKIESNNVVGFYIEVSTIHCSKIDIFPEFRLRQSTSNSRRYTTQELKTLEEEIINAKDIVLELELEIFESIANEIKKLNMMISRTASVIASIDVASSLAYVADNNNYVRPILNDSHDFILEDARHVVVEAIKKKDIRSQEFIGNSCDLSLHQRLWLITGPNMAGKSTFLRQNALIAILAQMGSYVPAKYARIGIIDRIFSRVGAADDLAKGRSTFMVEMIETATILNQASNKSLVILDEIGRGTATYDGLSIAWSTLEYIHNKLGCRALFATHYHELTELTNMLSSMKCYSMGVTEYNGQVIFLHKIVEGAINKSYGIHVAKLAGLPSSVIKRATQIMNNLENKNNRQNHTQDLPLFINNCNQDKKYKISDIQKLQQIIEEINVDELTPKDALNLIYEFKKLLNV